MKLTIVCENYWPEYASTGQLITELAEALAPDSDVEVLTAQPRYNAAYASRPRLEERNGVQVSRLRTTGFSKETRLGRVANWLSFLLSVTVAIVTRWRRRTYLFVTNPPTAPWALILARAMRQPSFVLVHDLYPDLAEEIGTIRKGGLAATAFDAANKLSFRLANAVVVLGQDMRRRVQEKLGDRARIETIASWANGDLITPLAKTGSSFAREHGLQDRFVFLYAGNLGLFQDLETVVRSVESLPGPSGRQASLVFVGNGAKRRMLDEVAAASAGRVITCDYVPYEDLSDLYAASDVCLIALEPGVVMSNVPSKTYSILAAGKPFIAVCQSNADL